MRVREEPFDKTHEIARAVGVPFRLTSSATLISCGDADTFLEACRAARLQVLGVEGFDLIDGGCRPDMGAILDLSSMQDASGSVDEAQSFVAEVCRDGLMFEFQLRATDGPAAPYAFGLELAEDQERATDEPWRFRINTEFTYASPTWIEEKLDPAGPPGALGPALSVS